MNDKAAEERGANREKIKRIVILIVTALVAGVAGRTTAPTAPADYAALDKRIAILEARKPEPVTIKLEHKPLKVEVIYPQVKK